MRSKPATATLCRSDPLAPGLALALVFNEAGDRATDLVTGRAVQWHGGLTRSGAADGPAPNFTGSTKYGFLADTSGAPINLPQAVFGRIAETDYQTGVFLGLDSGGTGYQLLVNTGGGTSGPSGVVAVAGVRNSLLATVNGTAATLYVDGALVASASVTNPGTTAKPLYIATASSLSGGPGLAGFLGQIHYLYAWSGRVLTHADAARLMNDPYSPARPRAARVYGAAASAGKIPWPLLIGRVA
jgi:hypothetical protein